MWKYKTYSWGQQREACCAVWMIKHTAGVNKEKPAVILDDEELAAMQEEPALMQDDVSIHGDLCGERYWDCHDRIWMLQNYF